MSRPIIPSAVPADLAEEQSDRPVRPEREPDELGAKERDLLQPAERAADLEDAQRGGL
jgi:hypothetical protein